MATTNGYGSKFVPLAKRNMSPGRRARAAQRALDRTHRVKKYADRRAGMRAKFNY